MTFIKTTGKHIHRGDLIFDNINIHKNKIENSEMSQHDASVGVGAALVDKYVKPKIN